MKLLCIQIRSRSVLAGRLLEIIEVQHDRHPFVGMEAIAKAADIGAAAVRPRTGGG